MSSQTILSAVAALVAGLVFLASILSEGSFRNIFARLGQALMIAIPVAAIAALSALHARGDLNLDWLFGSETSDIGPIEFGTAAFFGLSSALFGALLLRSRGSLVAIYLLLGVACLFVAGEEISWGQWIFHWETPASLAEANLQHETNLHNLINPRVYDPVYSLAGFLLIAAAAIGAIGSWRRMAVRLANGHPVFVPAGQVFSWIGRSTFALSLILCTGILLQHESFEEYAEFLLGFVLLDVALLLVGENRSAQNSLAAI